MRQNDVTRIAVPSMTDEGIGADVCAHFGSCEYFTVVEMANGEIKSVSVLSNVSPDGEHNCAAPAELLQKSGVDAVLVSGIGGRPLLSLTGKGIRVFGGAFGRVSDAIQDYSAGALEELNNGTCNCSHH
jgi:predicted Fe-Mo cluster-binding NifX family protein